MIERIIFFAVALLFANACLAYNPIIDGALVDLMIKVVDDRGETVSGAKVEVVIYTAPQKTEVKRGETDGKYEKELTYNVDRRGGKPDVVELPADDEYFVFRMRTVTNEVGKVIHANYGRIGEKSDHMFGLRMTTWFNTTDNDTNLEDARLR